MLAYILFCEKVMALKDERIQADEQALESLRDRIATIADEAGEGLQPVQSADESLTHIEHVISRLHDSRREAESRAEKAEGEVERLRVELGTAMNTLEVDMPIEVEQARAEGYERGRASADAALLLARSSVGAGKVEADRLLAIGQRDRAWALLRELGVTVMP